LAKQIDYPRASLKNSLLLAEAVDQLGGSCSTELAADKLGKQMSGAFAALVGAAVKYNLLTSKKGQLAVTQLYRNRTLAYTLDEANSNLQIAFLSPPLFKAIFERFENKTLPVSHFEKLLIREFGVPADIASRLATYFLEGAKQCELFGENHILRKPFTNAENESDSTITSDEEEPSALPVTQEKAPVPMQVPILQPQGADDEGMFSVRIKGPGMDSLIVINEEDDLDIVEIMLKKIRRRLKAEGQADELISFLKN
jgi:hypothetical protein